MAKNSQPIAKRCRALGISPAVMGYSKKSSNRNPGGKMRRKQSEYGIQLTEKQKVKFIYGILEKQFRMYYEKAEKMEGKTGENLLSLVERRLDNVVYRLGLCSTRREGRQLVNHAHFTVNGKKCNIPSYIVKAGDVIAVADGSKDTNRFKAIAENDGATLVPKWLEKTDKLSGKVIALPARDDIDYPVEEHLIVELYSK
ncbi:MAG: 30S ribosomal protein S4 [Ruminococcus sp.]|uniref:30S ribosomal protein S4 n=1 Tax=Ruminococcus sp. TaxID=41978 RepID=UPI00292D715A|nr:30S ribosomal protein S4 [uncultured Ruminococcus sp.]MBQ4238824.1 30S ribosomal protein S4 [Ruminococcus sp.]